MFKGQKTLAALAVSLLFTAPVYAAGRLAVLGDFSHG